MNRAAAAKHAKQPLLGNAALQDALAGFGVSTGAKDVLHVEHGSSFSDGNRAADAARERHELPLKTVAQVLGEITWLMTQSPRHKAIPLGDLEWLLMPAILLRQFEFSIRASSRSASRCGRWQTKRWRSGSMPASTA
jgi:cytolysin-activating lysine-acyltransferase